MKKTGSMILILLCACLIAASLIQYAGAQESSYRIAYTDVFGKLRRPSIEFDHATHEEALEKQGCGACHHAPDEDSGKLVYIQDEEVSCSECHSTTDQDGAPALREAFHSSCTGCHRQMKKEQNAFKGPTTCGECHRPE